MFSGICICDKQRFEDWWGQNKSTVRETFRKCLAHSQISTGEQKTLEKIIKAETIEDLQHEIGFLSFKTEQLRLHVNDQFILLPVVIIFYGSSLPLLNSVFENHIPPEVIIYRGETSNI